MIDVYKLSDLYNSTLHDIKHVTVQETINIDKDALIKEFSNEGYCPQNILECFVRCNRCHVVNAEQHDIKMHIYSENNLIIPITKILKSIRQIICLKNYFNINKAFDIYFVASPYKRFFPPDNSYVTPMHINGGYTYHMQNKIFILRVEEFSKVLIHEFLHHVRTVHNDDWNINQINTLKNAFNISKSTVLAPNEAIVELWATILHCIFLSSDYKITYKTLIQTETRFSVMQYRKMLLKQNKKPWIEKTNSYCYIVFKTILLYHLDEFDRVMSWPYSTDYVCNFLVAKKNTIPLVSMSRKQRTMRMMKLSDF